MLEIPAALANGIRTDHPIPGLPFVDDTLLPLDDPEAIEAIGRGVGEGLWGRWDGPRWKDGGTEQWWAFTTDPEHTDLAWCVRYHPEHGTTVLLLRDDDASPMHMTWTDEPLLFRMGGYWWDGASWYRPAQVWNSATEAFEKQPVKAAATVSAADALEGDGDASRGRVFTRAEFEQGQATSNWDHDLALWAARRNDRQDARPLADCVVNLSAPELSGDQLLDAAAVADLAGIAASTFRSYLSRGESDAPAPQTVIAGRPMWAKPVARDWVQARNRSSEGVTAALSSDGAISRPIGIQQRHERFKRMFFSVLWDNPTHRKRWALRHRNTAAVDEVADHLAWSAAVDLDRTISLSNLAITIRYAVLHELVTGRDLHQRNSEDPDKDPVYLGILQPVTRMLDWLIRHDPSRASSTIGEIIGDAYRTHDIAHHVTERSIRTALAMDSKLDKPQLNDFLDRTMPPKHG